MEAVQSPLSLLHSFIVHNRGAVAEANVLVNLLDLRYVLRSFEFALADAAIDCSTIATSPASFSERFWTIDEAFRKTYSEVEGLPGNSALSLLLFDVKSKSSQEAEGQIYPTTVRQRQVVCFYIAICTANSAFVEVFPNYYVGSATSSNDNPSRTIAVNFSRKSVIHPRSYRYLSPCNAPYRMPQHLLPEAMHRIRQCALGGPIYVNPWTGAEFPTWRPQPIATHESMLPDEGTQHSSAYVGIADIWRGMRAAWNQKRTPMRFEFVDVQPRLADFKLVLPQPFPTAQRRQYFVQYKIDSTERTRRNRKIAIGRHMKDGAIRWYCTGSERCVGPLRPNSEMPYIPHFKSADASTGSISCGTSFGTKKPPLAPWSRSSTLFRKWPCRIASLHLRSSTMS